MQFIKQNKEIFIQIIVFSIIGIGLHKTFLLYWSLGLIILLFIPQLASKYIDILNRFIHLFGYILKTILFSILFVFILCPVAIFKKKSNKMGYIHRNIILSKKSFEKMW